MSSIAGHPWDMYRAELADTRRGSKDARQKRPCIYCGKPTRALSRVCLDHDDLIDLDPGYPAALDETRVLPKDELAAELSSPTLVSSSAIVHVPLGGDNGERSLSGAVALDSLSDSRLRSIVSAARESHGPHRVRWSTRERNAWQLLNGRGRLTA